jgi:hypothetical protein
MVWKEGMKQWAAAGSVKGLFPPAADRPPAVASPVPPELSPSAPAVDAKGGVLGEAKGLLRSMGKLIAAQAQDAVKSAREATEAKARAVGRRLPAPRQAYAASSLPKRQIWLLAAGGFVVFSVLGLCVAGGIVTTGLQIGTGQFAEPTQSKQIEAKSLSVAIEGESFAINEKSITFPLAREELVKLLGKDFRKTNDILTWDQFGICAWQQRNDPDKLKTICFSLSKKDFIGIGGVLDYKPRSVFSGKLLVDGAEINADSDMDVINRTKRGRPFEQSVLNFWEIKYGKKYVIVSGPNQTQRTSTDIQKVDIGVSDDE